MSRKKTGKRLAPVTLRNSRPEPTKRVSAVTSFPGGSKSRVNRAGDAVRSGTASSDDSSVIETWRAAHRAVLNTFQAILRTRTRGKKVVVAQRHKRKKTIYDKLHRFPEMQLSRMDDIAGCRLIFRTLKELNSFRTQFHEARFRHKLVNDVDKYDYMKRPKRTGYRGIHDVYRYDVRSEVGSGLAGLFVEVQYRTLVQHAWATAVEVIGFVTESQPKFQQGEVRYQKAMALASEMLARNYEKMTGPYPELSDSEVVESFLALDKELGLMAMLGGLNTANDSITENKNTILIFKPDGSLVVQTHRDATEALRSLFLLEKAEPASDIVLVRADTSDQVRLAFRNYFSDASEFIRMIESSCANLSGLDGTTYHTGTGRSRSRKRMLRRKK